MNPSPGASDVRVFCVSSVVVDEIDGAIDGLGLASEYVPIVLVDPFARCSASSFKTTSAGIGGMLLPAPVDIVDPETPERGVVVPDPFVDAAADKVRNLGVVAPSSTKAFVLALFFHGGVPPVCTHNGYSTPSRSLTSLGMTTTPTTVCRSA